MLITAAQDSRPVRSPRAQSVDDRAHRATTGWRPVGHADGPPQGSRRAAPAYSAAPCTRSCTLSPGCTTSPAATQLAAVAPGMPWNNAWNFTCCPVVRLVQPPPLGAIPTTAPPTSVAPFVTGPRTRKATWSPEVATNPAASQSHGEAGSVSVTAWPVETFSQTAVCGVKPATHALSGCPTTSTSEAPMSQAPPAGWGRACQRWSLYRVVPQPLVPQGMASRAGLSESRAWVKVGPP